MGFDMNSFGNVDFDYIGDLGKSKSLIYVMFSPLVVVLLTQKQIIVASAYH